MRYDPDLPLQSLPTTYPHPHNSPYYLLRYHHGRLLAAAKDFQWPAVVCRLEKHDTCEANVRELGTTLDAHIPDSSRAWRLRVLLNRNGELSVETSPAPSLAENPLHLVLPEPAGFSSFPARKAGSAVWALRLDSQPTTPSVFTRHKTTRREMYSAARERVGIKSLAETVEVLMYNPQNEIMEGSITTVYVRRRRKHQPVPEGTDDEKAEWVTPPLSSGGNAGTTRRYALASGLCREEVVTVAELVDGEEAWLSNGARGFMPAVIHIDR